MLPTRDKRGIEPNSKRERRDECRYTLIVWRVYVKKEDGKKKKGALGSFLSLIKYLQSDY